MKHKNKRVDEIDFLIDRLRNQVIAQSELAQMVMQNKPGTTVDALIIGQEQIAETWQHVILAMLPKPVQIGMIERNHMREIQLYFEFVKLHEELSKAPLKFLKLDDENEVQS